MGRPFVALKHLVRRIGFMLRTGRIDDTRYGFSEAARWHPAHRDPKPPRFVPTRPGWMDRAGDQDRTTRGFGGRFHGEPNDY